ncbi:MAG: hypothetical protein AAGI11_12255 [Pseudomonadota bacterium]
MNTDSESKPERLPLPSPRSPESVDKRVLEFARDHAPRAGHRNTRTWWAGGMATACVAMVAVFIAAPEQPIMEERARDMATAQEEREPLAMEAAPRAALSAEASAAVGVKRIEANKAAERNAPAADAQIETEVAGDFILDFGGSIEPQRAHVAKLLELHELWSQGEKEAAQANWNAFIDDCGDCEFPASVEDAFETYLE